MSQGVNCCLCGKGVQVAEIRFFIAGKSDFLAATLLENDLFIH
jgi:hypothetical protein